MGKRWGVCQAIFAARCIGWMVVLTPEDQACSLAQSLIGFDKRIPFYTDGNLEMCIRDSPWTAPGFRCDSGSNIHVGDNFLANFNVTILDIGPVRIGDHVMIEMCIRDRSWPAI